MQIFSKILMLFSHNKIMIKILQNHLQKKPKTNVPFYSYLTVTRKFYLRVTTPECNRGVPLTALDNNQYYKQANIK
jgi:hypothetical protein